jgi:hypothetical protein
MLEIIKYNEIKYSNKKILLSVAIFKMYQSYRKFDKYYNSLIDLINQYYHSQINIRVYFDSTCIDEIFLLIQKYPLVEFYKYKCSLLIKKDCHEGTFGSLIRFLPLFEENSLYEFIYISDVEPQKYYLNDEILNKINNNEINTIFYSLPYYKRPWIHNTKYPIVNLFIITNIKISIDVFNKFLNNLISNKYLSIAKKCLDFRINKKFFSDKNRFPYGMDEYFSNNIINNYLLVKKTWIILDINPIDTIRHLKFLKNIPSDTIDLILLLDLLCNNYYKIEKLELIDKQSYIKIIKIIIKEITIKKLIEYVNDKLKEKSLKYFLNLLINKNIEKFDLLKQIN